MYDRGKTKIMLLLKTENIQICFMFDLHVLTHYHKNYFFFFNRAPSFHPSAQARFLSSRCRCQEVFLPRVQVVSSSIVATKKKNIDLVCLH